MMNKETKRQALMEDIINHSFLSAADYHTDSGDVTFFLCHKDSKKLEIIETSYERVMQHMQKQLLDEEAKKIFDILLSSETLKQLQDSHIPEKTFCFRSRLSPKSAYRWIQAHFVILEEKAKGFHVFASFRDVSELKMEEQRQKRINEYRMQALKNAFEELYIIDLNKQLFSAFNINDINEERESQHPFHIEDIHKLITTHVHPEDRAHVISHIQKEYLLKQFASEKKEVLFEYRLRKNPHTPYRWMYALIMQLKDDTQEYAFMLVKDITEEKQASEYRIQFQMLKEQMQLQIHHYDYVQERNRELRSFRHDLKNHLLVLESLHDKGDEEEFHTYINTMRGFLLKDKQFIDTQNPILDALLNEKFAYAQMNGIKLHHHIRIVANLPLSIMDTCILLGNGLDNAIEACMQMKDEEVKELKFQMVYLHGILVIQIENSVGKERQKNGITFTTTKEDVRFHGMGLRNMKNIVAAHDGLFDLHVQKSTVILRISMSV